MNKKSKSLMMIGVSLFTSLVTLLTCDTATAMVCLTCTDEKPPCGRACKP